MVGYREAAIVVLSEAYGALHSDEITKRAIEGGHIKPNAKTPGKTMWVTISKDIAKLGQESEFEKTGPSTFKLRCLDSDPAVRESGSPDSPPMAIAEHDSFASNIENNKMRNMQIATAGEYRVMSEMLLRGYGADKVTFDDGVDIYARKNGRPFEIQVKTSTVKNGRHVVVIGKKSFERKDGPQMYYVFVLRDENDGLDFVTFSSKDLKKMIKSGDIKEYKIKSQSQHRYQASLFKKGNKVFLGKQDVTQSRSDWDF